MGIMLVAAEQGPALADFAGLARRRMATAWMTVIMLLSLVGIPPLAGFFGKLYLFAAVISAGQVVWVVVAVAMSVVSAGYYLRIVRTAFFAEPETEGEPSADGEDAGGSAYEPLSAVAVAIVVALTVMLGVAAGPALTWLGVQ
jgi:NADH-quinone oxidoreductase subunit N